MQETALVEAGDNRELEWVTPATDGELAERQVEPVRGKSEPV